MPMLRLMLLRHAKSDWSVSGRRDRDRPLNARGRRAAPQIGAYLAAQRLIPDLAVVSPAARTRETWILIEPHLRKRPPVQFEGGIYEAPPRAVLAVIRSAPENVKNLLVVGHNPALQELALTLAGRGDAAALGRLAEKFPTASLAVIDFSALRWADIGPGAGRLDRFVAPGALAKTQED